MKEKEKDTLLEKEKDKPKNLHLDFTCNYREKNNVNYFLGVFIYRRDISLSEKIPQIRLKTPYLIFPMILRYKTDFFKNWDFLLMEGEITFQKKSVNNPKNPYADFACNYRRKNDVKNYLGFFSNGRKNDRE